MNQQLGRFGEAWAVGQLTRLGYRILERNVRCRAGEIDIVAEHEGDLVFVEVKCRKSEIFGSPQANIDARRYARLAGAIAQYLDERELEPESYRIDVVALQVNRAGRVQHSEIIRSAESPVS